MRLLPCTLLAVCAWAAAPFASGVGGPDEKLDRLLRAIRADPDAASARMLYDVARRGDEESFEALLTVIGWLRDPGRLEYAFMAFWYFRGDPTLAHRAVDFLEEQALHAVKRETRRVALYPLSYFGAKSSTAYEHILSESQDEECRARAIAPLLDTLLRRGDEASLRLVLDNAEAVDLSRKQAPFQAFDADVARSCFLKKLAERKTSVGWCLVLMNVLGTDPGEDYTELLREFLRNKSTVLQLAAVRALVARGQEELARAQLERMRLSAGPEVKVEVIRILTRLARGDPAWHERLRALARSMRIDDRIAAAAGFSELGGADGPQELRTLLDDKSWKVRAAVLAAAEELRSRDLLWPLIERLDSEEGLMRWKFAGTLERLTGLTLGRNAGSWKRWYAEQGAEFELPSREEVLALEAQRTAPRGEDATVATFYGLPVRSQRLAFVLDVSGSMFEPAVKGADDEDSPTRLDVAKRELGSLLQRLPEGSRCNFVFFADEIQVWEDELRPMDAKALLDAQEFIAQQRAGGGTNIHEALVAAFEDDAADTIYLLSDGDPSAGAVTDPLEIRATVAQWNSIARVTIHCVSVGQGSRLLADLAADSGGTYLEVGGKGDEASKK